MNTTDPNISGNSAGLSPLKRSLIALEEAEARIQALKEAANAPIAIIGIGCRVPGADGPDAFWNLLESGVDATGPVPADRWDHDQLFDPDPDSVGRISTRRGGFIDRIDEFDATLFGISLREARSMDPQQRVFLQTAWEALEHSGIAPDSLSGTATGVFCGANGADYTYLQLVAQDPELLDTHFASGMAHSVISGRLSYFLGLQGPSVTVDTACSSSLVAVHQAMQSLRRGESKLAIAGGVSLMLSPEIFIALSRAHMLSPDGRCKTFDARADGFARAEGCGVVILKPLADAQTDGDRIIAVLKGSAVNQDGPSSGLTAPSGPAQEAVIRTALAEAGVAPADLGYLEAHGTGTNLGDPQEMRAIGNVFGGRETPLVVGSVKTNLGHLEGAAGVTGLIKLALMLRAGQIPKHLHFETPSPHINWDTLPVRIPTELEQLEPLNGRRTASVSSFGFSGTNVHVVLEAAQPQPTSSREDRAATVAVSAASEQSLRDIASLHATRLAGSEPLSVADICRTANTGRAQLAYRATLSGTSAEELREGFDALSAGKMPIVGPVRDTPKVAFLFTGQGSQFVGMGRELYSCAPVFQAALDKAANALEGKLDIPLLDVMFGLGKATDELDQTEYTQPALFAFEYALLKLWQSWGVEPDIVIGHSVGEFTAACAAGVLSFEDAINLVHKRGQLMNSLAAGGGMMSVEASEAEVHPFLDGDVGIAALNAPNQTVISGSKLAIEKVAQRLKDQGIDCRPLQVSHAFHSSLVDPVLDAFEAEAAQIEFRSPTIRLVSNVTGKIADATTIGSPSYWRRHMRDAVRFADGAAELTGIGATQFVEIGPQPVLTSLARQILATAGTGADTTFLPSIRRGRGEWEQMQATLGELWKNGVGVDWRAVENLRGGRVVDLPTYAFVRDRHWFVSEKKATVPAGQPKGLFGKSVPVAMDAQIWDGAVSANSPDWVADHVVNGRIILPGAAFVSMMAGATRAAKQANSATVLEDVVIEAPLTTPTDGSAASLQTVLRDHEVSVFSCENDDWVRHATARVEGSGFEFETEPMDPVAGSNLDPVELYDELCGRGIELGQKFQIIKELEVDSDNVAGQIELPDAVLSDTNLPIHPLLLDGCLQLIAASPATRAAGQGSYLPFAIDQVILSGAFSRHARANVSVRSAGPDTLVADIRAEATDGQSVLMLKGLHLRRVAASLALTAGGTPLADTLYTMEWQALKSLPSPQDLVSVASCRSLELAEKAGLDEYDRFSDQLETACVDYVRGVFDQLGWSPAQGEVFSEEGLAEQLGIAAAHRRLFGRLLRILAEAGDLTRDASGWRVEGQVSDVGTGKEPNDLKPLAPAGALPELDMLQRAVPGFADALRGLTDPLELLFPGGDTRVAESLYGEVPTSLYFNGLVAAVIAQLSGDRPLRILEIGGGTGGTTAHVMDHLPTGSEYIFTDVGPSFVERAKDRFGSRPGTGFQVLDLEQDLVEQGIDASSIDLVVGANVVHATQDVSATLDRIRRVMKPDARLVLLEVTVPQRWFDLTVGLTPGWWAYSDTELRKDGPLLDRAGWLNLLERKGFSDPTALDGQPDLPGSRGRQTLVIAGKGCEHRKNWLIVPDSDDLAERLADALVHAGETATALQEEESLDDALARLGSAGDLPDQIVVLGGAGRMSATDRLASAVKSVQAVARAAPQAQVTLVTTGGEQVAGQNAAPFWEEAAIAGFARSVAAELPVQNCRRIDIEPHSGPLEPLVQALLEHADEPEMAVRGKTTYVGRLERWMPQMLSGPEHESWSLKNRVPGTLENLECQPRDRRGPGSGEIEIEVEVAGLNFRDVLNALGEYPGAPPLGGECAGRVTRVGDGVSGVSVGDAVVGMSPGSLASHVTLPAAMTVPLPDEFDMIDGATFAIPFVTADYCLRELGELKSGMRVLIHAAAGGVGMAALQIARAAGAEVFATAGTEEKRELVHALGAARVMDSRSPAFADEVLQATDGRGVDLVLNSLTGEMVDASLRTLAEGGCMIELGVRDVRDPESLTQYAANLRYEAVNWGNIADENPERIGTILRRVVAEFSTGSFVPLPRQCFSIAEVGDAFRLMARAGHIGKIAVTMKPQPTGAVRRAGTYLVTGGLSGLGLDTVQRLAEEGAGRIVATGRRTPAADVEATLNELRAKGSRIDVHVVDVADEAGMKDLLSVIRREGLPVRGVVHSAGTLSDAGIMSQDRNTIDAVMKSKVQGTQVLECLTRTDPLDFFCAFSSLAAVLGSPAQANHAAANAALGALMRARVSQGLPGLAIAWGPWADIGAAAGVETIDRLADQGVSALSPAEGRAACAHLISEAQGEVAVAPIDWTRFAEWRGGASNPVLPAGRVAADKTVSSGGPAPTHGTTEATNTDVQDSILHQLAAAAPDKKHSTLSAFLESEIRRAFALPEGRKLNPDTPFGELGLDSLLAIELRNRLGRAFDLKLPATLLFENPTLATLCAAFLTEILSEEYTDEQVASPGTASSDIFDGLEDLSDEELERMLGLDGGGNDGAGI